MFQALYLWLFNNLNDKGHRVPFVEITSYLYDLVCKLSAKTRKLIVFYIIILLSMQVLFLFFLNKLEIFFILFQNALLEKNIIVFKQFFYIVAIYFINVSMDHVSAFLVSDISRLMIADLYSYFARLFVAALPYIEPKHNFASDCNAVVSHITSFVIKFVFGVIQLIMQIVMLAMYQSHLLEICCILILLKGISEILLMFLLPAKMQDKNIMNSLLAESCLAQENIVYQQGDQYLSNKIQDLNNSSNNAVFSDNTYDFISSVSRSLVNSIGYAYLYVSQMSLYFNGLITISQLNYNVEAFKKVFQSIGTIIKATNVLAQISSAVTRLKNKEYFLIQIDNAKKYLLKSRFSSDIEKNTLVKSSGISIHYQEVKKELPDVNIERGKSYLITGLNGAGKSTLAKLLAGGILGEFNACKLCDDIKNSKRYYTQSDKGGVFYANNLEVIYRSCDVLTPSYYHTAYDFFDIQNQGDETYLKNYLKVLYNESSKIDECIGDNCQELVGVNFNDKNGMQGSSGLMQIMYGAKTYIQASRARALNKPFLLILDEAVSNLKDEMKSKYIQVFSRLIDNQSAMILITHDKIENLESFNTINIQ